MATSKRESPPTPAGSSTGDYHWPAIVDAMRDPAFVHDARFRILHANRAYAALAGMEVAATIGRPYWEAFPKGDGPLPACAAAMRNLPHDEITEELRLASGQIFTSRSFGLYDADGVYLASVHILEDITAQRRQEADLRYQKTRLEEVERVFRLGTWERDFTTNQSRWSDQLYRIFGFQPGEITASYETFLRYVHPNDRQRVETAVKNTLENHAPYDIVYRVIRADRAVRVFHAACETVVDPEGRVLRLIGTCQDITEADEAEQRLKRLNRMYRTISRCNQHLIRETNEKALTQKLCDTMVEEGGYRMAWVGYAVRDAAKTILPYAYAGAESGYLEEIKLTWADNERGSGPGACCIREGVPQVTRDIANDPRFVFWRAEAARRGYASSIALPLKNHGATFGFLGMYSPLVNAFDQEEVALLREVADNLTFGIIALRERAEREALTRELAYLSTHDRLTGLANRALLVDRLQLAMSYARRYTRLVAVVYLDLDRFKAVNDSLGTAAGDTFLKETAQRLLTNLRDNDTVARVGSDDFILVLADQDSVAGTTDKLARLRVALSEPMTVCDREIVVTASIGCSFYPDDGEDHETLIRRANAAMYCAKDMGRDVIRFFAPGLDAASLESTELETELRRAVARDELRLYYQPQLELSTGKLVGLEALLRWQHPRRGLLSPSQFISIAEDSGLIVAMGEWALREACRQAKLWQEAGIDGAAVAVNLSARQFRDKNLIYTVRRILRETGLDASRLELEITESSIMHDIE
ncbi:MAG: diguanylate cyclase, partial [Pseudomonadota bacterium]